ncbi:hypothetical protein J8281_02260 [Aquimarina sp. U1-2]|uniref:hypothetical protein n=1 Tax=Aquimarina sp. U1-2 TaxID=2823141 RepID=UPI001AEC75D4|nr:hypothetical protein [Aquimarina sp. U1-2]MBP2830998.1 hypothetical protein [Aquimarina sp. U1-2]
MSYLKIRSHSIEILVLPIVFFVYSLSLAQTSATNPLNDKQILKQLASEKAIELQKDLNLTIEVRKILEKSIFENSVKANKILQSKMSAKEKSKGISNLVYFQNEALKDILTVDQFYQYLSLQNTYVAGF